MTAATANTNDFLPVAAKIYSDRQRLFLLYFVGALIDLVVLGLFDQFSDKVYVDSFSTMALAAVLLQLLLKATIAVEHWVASHFKSRPGGWMKFLRFFCAWLVLFGSKFVILEALSFVFSDSVKFEGVLHGIVWLIIVVITMVIVEELVVRFYRKLA
jgi:membrane protease YdiL (CAAX protease family)